MKATLKADLDVTEMNKVLETYIRQEIQSSVKNITKNAVDEIVKSLEREKSLLKEELSGTAL